MCIKSIHKSIYHWSDAFKSYEELNSVGLEPLVLLADVFVTYHRTNLPRQISYHYPTKIFRAAALLLSYIFLKMSLHRS